MTTQAWMRRAEDQWLNSACDEPEKSYAHGPRTRHLSTWRPCPAALEQETTPGDFRLPSMAASRRVRPVLIETTALRDG